MARLLAKSYKEIKLHQDIIEPGEAGVASPGVQGGYFVFSQRGFLEW